MWLVFHAYIITVHVMFLVPLRCIWRRSWNHIRYQDESICPEESCSHDVASGQNDACPALDDEQVIYANHKTFFDSSQCPFFSWKDNLC